MSWTDERVNSLKKMWSEGHSASQIAKELGEITRNAVIGKVHRLGLSGRTTPSRPVKRPPRLARPKPRTLADGTVSVPAVAAVIERAQAAAVLKSPPPAPPAPAMPAAAAKALPPARLKDGAHASILTLRDTMCKWPIGDPSDPKFAFCGRKSECGPYCAEHAKVAFQPARKRETRKGEYDYMKRRVG